MLCKGSAPSKQALVRSPNCTMLIGTSDRGATPAKYGPRSNLQQRLRPDIASTLGVLGLLREGPNLTSSHLAANLSADLRL